MNIKNYSLLLVIVFILVLNTIFVSANWNDQVRDYCNGVPAYPNSWWDKEYPSDMQACFVLGGFNQPEYMNDGQIVDVCDGFSRDGVQFDVDCDTDYDKHLEGGLEHYSYSGVDATIYDYAFRNAGFGEMGNKWSEVYNFYSYDCEDNNASIFFRLFDFPGDGIDDNCDTDVDSINPLLTPAPNPSQPVEPNKVFSQINYGASTTDEKYTWACGKVSDANAKVFPTSTGAYDAAYRTEPLFAACSNAPNYQPIQKCNIGEPFITTADLGTAYVATGHSRGDPANLHSQFAETILHSIYKGSVTENFKAFYEGSAGTVWTNYGLTEGDGFNAWADKMFGSEWDGDSARFWGLYVTDWNAQSLAGGQTDFSSPEFKGSDFGFTDVDGDSWDNLEDSAKAAGFVGFRLFIKGPETQWYTVDVDWTSANMYTAMIEHSWSAVNQEAVWSSLSTFNRLTAEQSSAAFTYEQYINSRGVVNEQFTGPCQVGTSHTTTIIGPGGSGNDVRVNYDCVNIEMPIVECKVAPEPLPPATCYDSSGWPQCGKTFTQNWINGPITYNCADLIPECGCGFDMYVNEYDDSGNTIGKKTVSTKCVPENSIASNEVPLYYYRYKDNGEKAHFDFLENYDIFHVVDEMQLYRAWRNAVGVSSKVFEQFPKFSDFVREEFSVGFLDDSLPRPVLCEDIANDVCVYETNGLDNKVCFDSDWMKVINGRNPWLPGTVEVQETGSGLLADQKVIKDDKCSPTQDYILQEAQCGNDPNFQFMFGEDAQYVNVDCRYLDLKNIGGTTTHDTGAECIDNIGEEEVIAFCGCPEGTNWNPDTLKCEQLDPIYCDPNSFDDSGKRVIFVNNGLYIAKIDMNGNVRLNGGLFSNTDFSQVADGKKFEIVNGGDKKAVVDSSGNMHLKGNVFENFFGRILEADSKEFTVMNEGIIVLKITDEGELYTKGCVYHEGVPTGPTQWCGDMSCNLAEDCLTCPEDCGACEDPVVGPSIPRNLVVGLEGWFKAGPMIRLSWDPPFDEGSSPIKGYLVERKKMGGAYEVLQENYDGTNIYDYAAVAGERPEYGVEYSYRVTAKNSDLSGPTTEPVSTLQGCPVSCVGSPYECGTVTGIVDGCSDVICESGCSSTQECNDYNACVERSSGGGGTCFPSDSSVTMYDGSLKEIENVEIGDYVLSFDFENNNQSISEVTHVFVHNDEGPYSLIQIITNSGTEILPTSEHLFYTENQGWVAAYDLSEGDLLLTDSGRFETIVSIQTSEIQEDRVFNLETGLHNYFANGILVHNDKLDLCATSNPPPYCSGVDDGGCPTSWCMDWGFCC